MKSLDCGLLCWQCIRFDTVQCNLSRGNFGRHNTGLSQRNNQVHRSRNAGSACHCVNADSALQCDHESRQTTAQGVRAAQQAASVAREHAHAGVANRPVKGLGSNSGQMGKRLVTEC